MHALMPVETSEFTRFRVTDIGNLIQAFRSLALSSLSAGALNSYIFSRQGRFRAGNLFFPYKAVPDEKMSRNVCDGEVTRVIQIN